MTYKEMKKRRIGELSEALGVANQTIFAQTEEIRKLNNICEQNDKFYKRELYRKDAVIEYLESKT